MRKNQLTHSRKSKILSQLFTGEPALLEQLKRPPNLNRSLSKKDYITMTDAELEQIIWAGMSDEERANYRPIGTLTDEELERIIAGGSIPNKELKEMTTTELDQSIAFLEATEEKEKRSHEPNRKNSPAY